MVSGETDSERLHTRAHRVVAGHVQEQAGPAEADAAALVAELVAVVALEVVVSRRPSVCRWASLVVFVFRIVLVFVIIVARRASVALSAWGAKSSPACFSCLPIA